LHDFGILPLSGVIEEVGAGFLIGIERADRRGHVHFAGADFETQALLGGGGHVEPALVAARPEGEGLLAGLSFRRKVYAQSAFDGDGLALQSIADWLTERRADGTYKNNANEALYAVNCIDRPDRWDPQQTQKQAQDWSKEAPVFGAALAWGNLPCYYWPAPAVDAPHEITAWLIHAIQSAGQRRPHAQVAHDRESRDLRCVTAGRRNASTG